MNPAEQQRQQVEREAALEKELFELGHQASGLGAITQFGFDKSKPETPWCIQRNGKDEFFSLENGKSKLQEIINESTSK